MSIVLPLDKMTIPDKLRAMEQIWDDLQRASDDVPSPAWHRDVLAARELRVREGVSHYGDWTEAKRRIRDQVK